MAGPGATDIEVDPDDGGAFDVDRPILGGGLVNNIMGQKANDEGPATCQAEFATETTDILESGGQVKTREAGKLDKPARKIIRVARGRTQAALSPALAMPIID